MLIKNYCDGKYAAQIILLSVLGVPFKIEFLCSCSNLFSWNVIVTNLNIVILFLFFNFQGLEPGTVVISRRAVNALLEPFNEQVPSVYILICNSFRGNKDYVVID